MNKIRMSLLNLLLAGCSLLNSMTPVAVPRNTQDNSIGDITKPTINDVLYENRWGIYRLEIDDQIINLIYSSPLEISTLRLNNTGNQFVFSQPVENKSGNNEEIFTLSTDGNDLKRITHNDYRDLYPAWSPEGSKIAFLSLRSSSLGIFLMNSEGSNFHSLYDSSANEADIDWRGDQITFTKESSIWIMRFDGTDIHQVTHPPRAGEWGKVNLPFGDYDPRISPDGTKIIFERLTDDQTPYGNYDLYMINLADSHESQLTYTGYSQGLASWSRSGDKIVYIVAAVDNVGLYDIHIMNSEGTEERNITPQYFPQQFLCRWVIFSDEDNVLYFIGEWWTTE